MVPHGTYGTRRGYQRVRVQVDLTQGLCCHGTRYVRHARGWYAYGVRTVAHQLPCASGAYGTQEAGTRSPYVRHGCGTAYGSAQGSAAVLTVERSATATLLICWRGGIARDAHVQSGDGSN